MESVGMSTAVKEQEALASLRRKKAGKAVNRRYLDLVKSYSLRIGSVAVFLILWNILTEWNVMWPLQFGNMPSPLSVLHKWERVAGSANYYVDLLYSVSRVTLGIVLGLVLGVPLGIWIGLSDKAENTLFPSLEIFRPVPLIAFLPSAMLLFKTIEGSIVFITFVGAFFPILISTRSAVKRVSATLINASKCLGCTPAQAVWKVYLPATAPQIFSALTVGVGASWMGVITAEMIAGQYGIGYYTWEAYQLMQYDDSLVGMFTIGLLGFVFSAVVRLLEKMIVKWKNV